MMVVGEPSGDLLGGQIMAALKRLTDGQVDITGVGGPAMAAEGLESLYSIADTSVMGFNEVVPKIPTILARVRQAADFAIKTRPDLVVLIDSPDFTHRIGRRLSKRAPDITVVKYVAPQVWASRPGRAKKLAEFVDHLLCLLPFEPPFFESYGLDTRFVGHPVVERVERGDGAAFRARHKIPGDVPVLAVLPGSRSNEVRMILPVFKEAVGLLAGRVEELQTVIVTLEHVREKVLAGAEDWPTPLVIVDQDEKRDAFAAADTALAASGTVSTELALAKVPMVIAYKIGWFTYALFRGLIKVPFITLINLIQKRGVIPELVQDNCRAEDIAEEAEELLLSDAAARQQVDGCQSSLVDMGLGDTPPSERAAQALLDIIAEQRG
jgi:lipid-A-disaccharide synthase